jgi:CheY-like chemotaxis protein
MPEVLYVEDDDALRGLYADSLREAGFRVREVRLAEEGLHAVRCVAPDLVLLDLSMPPGEMSGVEALARLREDRASADIPVILFSGLGNILNPELLRTLRVAAVVAKPARVRQLVDVIGRVVLAGPSRTGIAGTGSPAPVAGSREPSER